MHLIISIQTRRTEKQLERRAIVGGEKVKSATSKHTVLSRNCTCQKQTQAKTSTRYTCTTELRDKKVNSNVLYYNPVSIFRKFVDTAELSVSKGIYLRIISSYVAKSSLYHKEKHLRSFFIVGRHKNR